MATVSQELRAARRDLAAQPRARQQLIESFQARALRAAVDEAKAAGSIDDLREWTEIFGTLLSVERERRGHIVSLLLDDLRDAGLEAEDPQLEAAALEQWGRLQVLDTYERVRGESHTVGWLEEHGVSRQRLNQWRRGGRLFAIRDVPGVKGFAYPRWQFSDSLRPKAWLAQILDAAQAARLDGLGLHLLMTNPRAGNGRSPLELAESGALDTAVQVVAAANAHGA